METVMIMQETETEFTLYPDLNREVLKKDKRYTNLLRVWYIVRAFDKKKFNGTGCIPKKDCLEALSVITPYKQSYLYQLLVQGEGLFWNISQHKDRVEYIHYFGIKKLALIFGITRYSEENILLMEECLLGDTTQVRANFYITAIGKNSSYTPIARETIANYFGFSINTQRKYEKITTIPMEKTSSYILYKQTTSLEKALEAKKKLLSHQDTNPKCVKIKRDSHDRYLVLYQRGNLYSSIPITSHYPSTLRKCNQKLYKYRRDLMNGCFQPSDHNDERLVGALEDKDHQLYYFKNKPSTGNYSCYALKKDRYVYDKIIEACKESPYFKGVSVKENICLYKTEFCHPESPLGT